MLKAWCTVCECELHQNSDLFVTHVGLGKNRPGQMARRLKEEQQGLGIRMNKLYWG